MRTTAIQFLCRVQVPRCLTSCQTVPCRPWDRVKIWPVVLLGMALLLSVSWLESNGLAQTKDVKAYRVDIQPLAANVKRIVTTLENIGASIPEEVERNIQEAIAKEDVRSLISALKPVVALRLKIDGQGKPVQIQQLQTPLTLYQNEHRPVIVEVVNRSELELKLKPDSINSGEVYAGTSLFSLRRQRQTELGQKQNQAKQNNRYLDLDLYRLAPMNPRLSGLEIEYAILLVHSTRSGKQISNIWFDSIADTATGGKNGESEEKPQTIKTDLSLEVLPAIPVRLAIKDPTQQTINPIAKLEIRDKIGRIYPNQPKRLAPDFFFQPHIYRRNGELIYLTPGEYTVRFSRGPEYRLLEKKFKVTRRGENTWTFDLQRWIQPESLGYYSGDHHIHAAGCAHYTSPTQGVTPAHMYRQVTGEGLNVGCVLTWGPCFDFQRQYFAPVASAFENRETILKYDIEVSGFGSQALGHVCLLNLKNQTYPNSDGTKTKGWPTWTTPVMKWAKQQGGYTGYAHSASGLSIDPANATKRLFETLDRDRNRSLSPAECQSSLLPYSFASVDKNGDGRLTKNELIVAHQQAAGELPNFAIPEMNGVGAMEICVSAVAGVCDFISAMDTSRIQEWNTWYHLLNCGFPIKVSGETDFPCMSSLRVGKGRVYVKMDQQLAKGEPLDFGRWCRNLALGRSYISDGFAHATEFSVNGNQPGHNPVHLKQKGKVEVKFSVAFAPQTPEAVAHGTQSQPTARQKIGDTVELHHPREHQWITGGKRKIELIVNGQAVFSQIVPADGKVHTIEKTLEIGQSSWVAVRQFPQLHTNPVNVIVAQQPIRASRQSAMWCIGMTELVWQNRQRTISPAERPEAQAAFETALKRLRQIAGECVGSNK